jgi:outer membrane protein assembly factor BamB
VYLYTPDGLYLLDPTAGSSRQILALTAAYPSLGSALGLPDGGVLLAHLDRADRLLIALDPAGRLRWERSLAGIPEGTPGLALVEGEVYLTVMSSTGALNLYAVDLGSGALRWMIAGGTRTPRPGDTALFGAGAGRMVLQIGGGSLVGLELNP